MPRCPELRRLPKSPRFSSILWRHQSPGSIAVFLGSAGFSASCLDPSHPATRWKARGFPQYTGKEMQIRILPTALLQNPMGVIYPFRRPFLTWSDRVKRTQDAGIMSVNVNGEPNLFWKDSGRPVEPEQLYFEDEQEMVRRARLPECRATPKGPLLQVAAEKARRRVPMSFFTVTSKARMGAKRCTRRTITLRVKAALNLIVTRGAYYGEESKKNSGYIDDNCIKRFPSMKFDEKEAESMGRKWILQGWSYAFSPTLEVYRMPYSKLIPILREALTTLRTRAIEMENKWLANSLLHEQRMALKARTPRSEVSQHVVNKEDATPPQHSDSKPSTSTPRQLCSKATTRSTPRSSFNAAWRRNLEAELQLLANVRTKP